MNFNSSQGPSASRQISEAALLKERLSLDSFQEFADASPWFAQPTLDRYSSF